MLRLFIFLVLILINMDNATAREFSEGQVWTYRTRQNELESTLIINKVESDLKLGKIYHISISRVKVRNPNAPTGVSTELPHFPVSTETLEKSCLLLLKKSNPNPNYREGYQEWLNAFNQGKAGVFTISVSEIIDTVEMAISK
jgi:hypothetical protein